MSAAPPASEPRGIGADARRDVATVRWLGSWYVAEHNIRAMRPYITTFLMLGFGTPVLYVLGFGLGLAVIVDATGSSLPGDVPFLTFLAPALMLGTAFSTAANESTYGVFSGFVWRPIYPSMSATPIAPRQIVEGTTIGMVVRALPPAAVFIAIMALAGAVPRWTGALMLLVALALILAVTLPVMAWVATQRHDRGQLSLLMRFVVLPLVLFSGTYYPLDVLPIGLQWIGWISPLWHAVDLARWCSYGAPLAPWLAAVHMLVLAAFIAAGYALAVRNFERRLAS